MSSLSYFRLMIEIFNNDGYTNYHEWFHHNDKIMSYSRNILDNNLYDYYRFQNDIFEFLSITIIKNKMFIQKYGVTECTINFDNNVLDLDDTSLVLTHGRSILDDSLFPQDKDDFMILFKNITHLKEYNF